jgi:predicted HicB family RNase H-like nuclease
MKNVVEIDGHKAVISLDPEIKMFRGEFLGLSGGADFYGKSIDELMEEGRRSLSAYLELCKKKNVNPFREFSGRFNVRLTPQVHETAVFAAAAQDQSLNEWVANAIESTLYDDRKSKEDSAS